jgi:hypothetical protein
VGHHIGVIHRRQVEFARAEGLVAFGHGKRPLVANLAVGDTVIYYAPRTEPDGEPVQAFVAHATVTGEAPYERDFGVMGTGWVRAAAYDDVAEVPVRPLLDRLEFLARRGRNWGMAFRGGRFAISEGDHRLIAGAMGLG